MMRHDLAEHGNSDDGVVEITANQRGRVLVAFFQSRM